MSVARVVAGFGRGVAVIVQRLHTNHNGRDVVQTAAPVGLGNERVHNALNRGARHEKLLQPAIVYHAREAIAGHQERVAPLDFARVEIRLHFAGRSHAARDDVGIRVIACLLRREHTRVHLLLHVGVILRELPERAVAEEIDARIADVSDEIATAVQHQHRGRGAHPLLVRLQQRALIDGHVGVTQRVGNPLACVIARVRDPRQLRRDDSHGHVARHFAGSVPAHSIGDDEEPRTRIREQAVLVARPDHPGIGGLPNIEPHKQFIKGERRTEDSSS
jgi:hypothetical protein